MSFGSRLKELRNRRGMTQRTLASYIYMDCAYLSRIENNHLNHLPTRKTIENIALVLDLSPAESDELHILAGKIPEDVELVLFKKPDLMNLVRKKAR